MLLSQLKPGQKAVINQIQTTPAKRRLMEMGLVKGTQLLVICRAPLGDPIEIEIRDYKLTIRGRDAKNIFVDVNGGQ